MAALPIATTQKSAVLPLSEPLFGFALGREINPEVFAVDDFAARARSEPFLRDVLSRPKIFLVGNARDLEALAGHQP